MYYYALVLRKTVCISIRDKDKIIKLMDRYEKMLNYFKSTYFGLDINYTFEIVEKQNNKINLHLHAMVKSESTPYVLMSPPREKGISTYFEECNPLAWDVYCAKQPFTREKVIKYVDNQNRPYVDEFTDEMVYQCLLIKHLNKYRLV